MGPEIRNIQFNFGKGSKKKATRTHRPVQQRGKPKTTIESGWDIADPSINETGVAFSVIIPAFNAQDTVIEAIESAVNQTIRMPIEIIVIDDCSKDNTYAVVENYVRRMQVNPMRIVSIMRNNKNSGVAFCRNKGVIEARGDYIAYLDADDWWELEKLEYQYEYLKKKCDELYSAKEKAEMVGKKVNVKFPVLCCTGRELTNPDGSLSGKIIHVPKVITYDMLLKVNYIPCSSVIIKRAVAKEIRMSRDDLHEDYLTWLRVTQKYGPAIGIDKPLLNSRMTENGRSRNKLDAAVRRYKCYKAMDINPLKAHWYFFNYMIEGIQKYH